MWSSCFCSKLIQNFSNYLKHLPEVSVDTRFSSIMLEKCLVLLEKCSVWLENFFKINARDRSVIARNFPMLEMLDHFFARDRSDRKFKIKYCARDRSDRKFQCSKCSRSMFLQLGLNSKSKQRDVLLRLVHIRPGLKSSRDSNSFMSDFLSNMIRLFSEGYTLFTRQKTLHYFLV